MISKETFTKNHIENLRRQYKVDPQILERTIFAFGVLESMVKSGAEFIFKGGTSLMLLLDKLLRLSTDIDIITNVETNIVECVKKASVLYPFVRYEEDVRIGANNIVKKHFRFFYRSLNDEKKELPILLDVLFEENHYSKLLKKEIKNSLLIIDGDPVFVDVPSPDSLLGDKLTAFAPKTIGVLPISNKSNGKIVDKRIEVIKQFFDIASLFDVIDSYDDVLESYKKTALSELNYRGLDLSFQDCLKDTLDAAICICSRGKYNPDDYLNYLIGIRGLSNYLINISFNAEKTYIQGAKIIYLISCLLTNKQEVIKSGHKLIEGKYNKLNYIRKIDQKSFDIIATAIDLLSL